MIYQFDSVAIKPYKWISPGFIAVDRDQRIISVSSKKPRGAIQKKNGIFVPGFINCHSHAFQFGMRGRAESAKDNDFWLWRKKMYELALSLNADEFEKVSNNAFRYMKKNGFTHVVEFHYVHHDERGRPYKNPVELSERIISAAKKAGIGLTLLPVLYQRSDEKTPLRPEQKRFFIPTADEYFKFHESLSKHKEVILGMAVHSPRAVLEKDLCAVLSRPGVKHIHIAEQISDVKRSLAVHKMRSIEWLAKQNIKFDSSLSLVHATHANDAELKLIAKNNVNVVICPTTEANLGDGIFPFWRFQELGGKWSIGSDSHIAVNPLEELRLPEQMQRLLFQKRVGQQKTAKLIHLGAHYFFEAVSGGRRVAGLDADWLKKGTKMHGFCLNFKQDFYKDLKTENDLLGVWVMAGNISEIIEVF